MTRTLYGVSKPTRAAKLATVHPADEVMERCMDSVCTYILQLKSFFTWHVFQYISER